MNRLTQLLKLEGFAEGCLGVAAFAATGESWWLFALLCLAPDLALVAYLRGPKFGAWAYNITHSSIGPILLALASLWSGGLSGVAVAAVWFAHIGFDRALGYGLKSVEAFKTTHLGEIGVPCVGK
jgi:Domain of unknown function (DUF4260)